jgi:lipopolysaccharide transport system permease protein
LIRPIPNDKFGNVNPYRFQSPTGFPGARHLDATSGGSVPPCGDWREMPTCLPDESLPTRCMATVIQQQTIIQPNGRWFSFQLGAVWTYRELVVQLVRRDFVARFRQNVLGPAWFVLMPLAMTLVFTVVFGKIGRIATDGLPGPLFYMSGLFVWNLISSTFSGVAATFHSNAHLFGKVYFPRLVVPAATACNSLIQTSVQLLSFGLLVLWFGLVGDHSAWWLPSWTVLALPLLIILALSLGVGCGLVFASITAKYRDLAQTVPFLTQIWLYLSAVVFPVSAVPAHWQWLVVLNPAVGIVGLGRSLLLNQPLPEWSHLLASGAWGVVLMLAGIALFNRTARTVVDTI